MNNINTNFRKAYTDLTAKINFYDEKIEVYGCTHPSNITEAGVQDLVSLRRNRSLYSKLQNLLLYKFGKQIKGENHA